MSKRAWERKFATCFLEFWIVKQVGLQPGDNVQRNRTALFQCAPVIGEHVIDFFARGETFLDEPLRMPVDQARMLADRLAIPRLR